MGRALIRIKGASRWPLAAKINIDHASTGNLRRGLELNKFGIVLVAALVLATGLISNSQGASVLPGSNPRMAMTVTIVRSNQYGCEPSCPEWIVADGEITAATPARFRKVFKLAGKDDLPIVLNSNGGSVEAAMEIGRMIRSRKARTVVAKTQFERCSPLMQGKCDPSSPHKPRYSAYFTVSPGYCVSACVFIFAGGTRRIADLATVGTHQVVSYGSLRKVWFRETYRIVHGKKKVLSRKIVKQKTVTLKPTTNLRPTLRKKFARYFSEMGIGDGLMPLFEKASPEDMYYPTSSELYGSKLATEPTPYSPIFRKEICQGRYTETNCITLQ